MNVYPEVCQPAIWEYDICQHPNCQRSISQLPNSKGKQPYCNSVSANGRLMLSAKNPKGMTEAKQRMFDHNVDVTWKNI